MVCTYCSGSTSVINSRLQKRLNRVWRRRKCDVCKSVFTTIELINASSATNVIDSHRGLSPFMRDKLFLSIYKSCGHRASAAEDATALTDTVMSRLKLEGSIPSNKIKTTVYEMLKRFDGAAAVQYNAYHRAK